MICLSTQQLMLIAAFVFLAAAAELSAIMYKIVHTLSIKKMLKSIISFTAILLFCAYIIYLTLPSHQKPLSARFPAASIVAATAVFANAVFEFLRERHNVRTQLSPACVKQALDNINSGICFANATGKVVMINHVMLDIAYALTGSYPQTLSDLKEAVSSPDSHTIQLDDSSLIYRLPDSGVWNFSTIEIEGEGLEGFTQTTAKDVTEIYSAISNLRSENEALRLTNQKTKSMYDRLADRIREQEILNLKMKIHNDLGASLIAINEIMNGEINGDVGAQLSRLENAVSYFSSGRPTPAITVGDAVKFAGEMNVGLVIDGKLPENSHVEQIIVSAAKECITNCINHAHGNKVFLEITLQDGICKAVFTNNGDLPDGPVREGGGLSALRRKIESANGEMTVSHKPQFALTVKLPILENEI